MYVTPEEVQQEEEEKKERTLLESAMMEGLVQGGSYLAGKGVSKLSQMPINYVLANAENDPELVKILMADAAKKGIVATPRIGPTGNQVNAWFSGADRTVSSHDKLIGKPGIIGHELGHATSFDNDRKKYKDPRHWGIAGQVGLAAPTLGTLINTVGHNWLTTNQMLGIGGLSVLPYLPRLIEEFKASKIGYDMMREKGKGVKDSLTAFAGFPTYLAQAAMPFVPAAIASLLGRTADRKKPKKKDKDKKDEDEKDEKSLEKKAVVTPVLMASIDGSRENKTAIGGYSRGLGMGLGGLLGLAAGSYLGGENSGARNASQIIGALTGAGGGYFLSDHLLKDHNRSGESAKALLEYEKALEEKELEESGESKRDKAHIEALENEAKSKGSSILGHVVRSTGLIGGGLLGSLGGRYFGGLIGTHIGNQFDSAEDGMKIGDRLGKVVGAILGGTLGYRQAKKIIQEHAMTSEDNKDRSFGIEKEAAAKALGQFILANPSVSAGIGGAGLGSLLGGYGNVIRGEDVGSGVLRGALSGGLGLGAGVGASKLGFKLGKNFANFANKTAFGTEASPFLEMLMGLNGVAILAAPGVNAGTNIGKGIASLLTGDSTKKPKAAPKASSKEEKVIPNFLLMKSINHF